MRSFRVDNEMSGGPRDGLARPRSLTRALAAILALAASPALAQEPKKVDFAHDIVPILKTHCVKCHANGTYKGSFSFDTRESVLKSDAVVAGKSGESEIMERLTSDDPEMRMPPKGDRVSAQELSKFKAWIDEGVNWEDGFTFKESTYNAPLKLKKVDLPPAKDGRDHPIDRIVDAYFAKNKVTPQPPLDDAAFLRRASLDLIGLLPTPAQRDAFVKDSAPDKRTQFIKRTLDDKVDYAEHWLSFWNDLLRNDYKGTGYIDGGRKQISGWLYQSLVENKPYDRFVFELISPAPESEGFIQGIQWRGRVNASQVREIQFSQNVSQVFFGVNMKCASCHDSFIDRWKLNDAYGLAAIIAEKPLEIHRCDKPTGKTAVAKFLWPELGSIDASLPKLDRLEQLAKLVTHQDNGRFTRTIVNRIWQRLMGRGIVQPVDVMGNEPWSEDLLDYLAGYLVEHKYDLKALIEHIVTSQVYQSRPAISNSEAPGDNYVFKGPEIKRMTAEEFIDAIWMTTHSGPDKADAPFKRAAPTDSPLAPPQFIRASLVHCDELMRSLGRPNREQVVTTRGENLTTLQALDLSNGESLAETLKKGAGRWLEAHPNESPDRLVEDFYLQAMGRKPSADEAKTAAELVGSPASADGLADLFWVIFMLPEFQLIH